MLLTIFSVIDHFQLFGRNHDLADAFGIGAHYDDLEIIRIKLLFDLRRTIIKRDYVISSWG